MGQMIDGVWHTEDLPVADAAQALQVRAASPQNPGAITFMFRGVARGPTAPD
jgi:hypothetical protein